MWPHYASAENEFMPAAKSKLLPATKIEKKRKKIKYFIHHQSTFRNIRLADPGRI